MDKKETESYEASIRKHPFLRLMACVALLIVIGLIVLVFVTGVTGSKYFLPSLALLMLVPVLLYVVLWLGKVLQNHNKKQS